MNHTFDFEHLASMVRSYKLDETSWDEVRAVANRAGLKDTSKLSLFGIDCDATSFRTVLYRDISPKSVDNILLNADDKIAFGNARIHVSYNFTLPGKNMPHVGSITIPAVAIASVADGKEAIILRILN